MVIIFEVIKYYFWSYAFNFYGFYILIQCGEKVGSVLSLLLSQGHTSCHTAYTPLLQPPLTLYW